MVRRPFVCRRRPARQRLCGQQLRLRPRADPGAYAATAVTVGSPLGLHAGSSRGIATPADRRRTADTGRPGRGRRGRAGVAVRGIGPWWPLCAAALATRLAAGHRAAPVREPWRISAAVTVTAGALAAGAAAIGVTRLRMPAGPLAVIAVAVGALARRLRQTLAAGRCRSHRGGHSSGRAHRRLTGITNLNRLCVPDSRTTFTSSRPAARPAASTSASV